MVDRVQNVSMPYLGPVIGGITPGKLLRLVGVVRPSAQRFAVNLQCGPNVNPRDDIALHVCTDFTRKCVVRNSILNMNWGPEETSGDLPLYLGQTFEINILCSQSDFKIAINGRHYTTFEHRLPYQRITHLALDGDADISLVEFSSNMGAPAGYQNQPPYPIAGQINPPYSVPVPGSCPYPQSMPHTIPAPSSYPLQPPLSPHRTGIYSPYPQQAGYPLQAGYPQQAGYAPYPQQPGFPQSPYYPGQPHKSGGIMQKAAPLLAGAGVASMLGKKNMFKSHKKAQKKALKYGLPLAGAGLGAYALHKTFHHSSSSSSSSSSEEE